MKKSAIILIFLLLLQLLPVTAYADVYSGGCHSLMAEQALVDSNAYTGTAKAAILYEMNTQTLVLAHNPDARINPTGLVKLMTALIALEEGNLEDVVTVKQSVLNMVSSGAKRIGLKAKDQLTVKDLAYCVMVSSANDAAVVLADHIAGSQSAFVEKMNARAATLGCTNTHFADVNGLEDKKQYSTARDMAIITQEALKNPQFVELFGTVNHQLPETVSCGRALTSTNSILNPNSSFYDARVTGGKPSAAGSADRSMICTAETEEARYLCVVISVTDNKSNYAGTMKEVANLLNLGFDGFAVQQVLGTEQPFSLYPVSNGENHVVVGTNEEVYALLPVPFDATELHFRDVRLEETLVAPLAEGAVVGKLQVFYHSLLIGEVDLLARHDVAVFGTAITTDTLDDSNRGGTFAAILKWIGIILFVVLLLVVVALLVLRRINKVRYQQQKRRRAGQQERREV